jgi:hypothetical protein
MADEFHKRMCELGEALGLSPAEAEGFADGREGPPPRGGYDGLVDFGRTLGLNEAGARMFARGRSVDGGLATEHEAREAWDGAPSGSTSVPTVLEMAARDFAAAAERFHGMDAAQARQHAREEVSRLLTKHQIDSNPVAETVADLKLTTKALNVSKRRAVASARASEGRIVREGGTR